MGGPAETTDFYRLFMAPGVAHCRGGPGPDRFDAVAALERWVEEGVAPDRLVAAKVVDGAVQRTRPLCPTRRWRAIEARAASTTRRASPASPRTELRDASGATLAGATGSASILDLLLSRRAPDALVDDEPDRVAVRDGAAAAASDEGSGLPDEGAADGLFEFADPVGQLLPSRALKSISSSWAVGFRASTVRSECLGHAVLRCQPAVCPGSRSSSPVSRPSWIRARRAVVSVRHLSAVRSPRPKTDPRAFSGR